MRDKASDDKITDEELRHSSSFSHLVKGLCDVVYETKSLYENIKNLKISNPRKTINYSSNLGLRLGFDKEIAKEATIKAIGYYGIAVVERRLPENFDEVSLLTRATQIDRYGDKLIDFSPITFHSVDENHYVLVPDAGRETWMLAKHLKLIEDSGFNVSKHPEMFEGLNVKIIANAYSIFDAPYGINRVEQSINGRTLKPTDNDVWDLIMLQWSLYSNKAPQLGGGDKLYNRDFPWYDSDKLDSLYKDANNRRQALFFLFFLDNVTFDMKKGKVQHQIRGDVPAWLYYYSWILDRGLHGLENTHLQYLGLKPSELREIMLEEPENMWNRIKDLDGVDQFVTKNWDYWHLMKFVAGYERWKPWEVKGMIEDYTVNYLIPQTLRAFGFPTYFVHINPAPIGAGDYEWVVSLPDYVAEKLKSEFKDKIIIGPANGFGLYLCKDGLLKDGIREIFGFIGGWVPYRRKKEDGTTYVYYGLAPNFKFYFVKK